METTAQNRTTSQSLLPIWTDAFIAVLRETGIVRDACEATNIGRRTAYDARERDPEFRAAWDQALQDAADLLEREAVRRARIGVREPVIYKGQLSGMWVDENGEVVSSETPGARLVPLTVTKYSDGLMMFLLKGIRPDKFNAHTTNVNVGSDPSRPLTIDHTGTVEHDHQHVVTTPASAAVLEFLRDLGLPCPDHLRADGGEQPVDRGDGAPSAPEATTLPPAQ